MRFSHLSITKVLQLEKYLYYKLTPYTKKKPVNVDVNEQFCSFLVLSVSKCYMLTVANICHEPHIYKNASKLDIHFSLLTNTCIKSSWIQ